MDSRKRESILLARHNKVYQQRSWTAVPFSLVEHQILVVLNKELPADVERIGDNLQLLSLASRAF